MNGFIKWYLALVLSRPILRAVNWTVEERSAFDHFARSSCGLKLFEFLRQVIANATFNAVYRDKVSANAHARGMQDILALLHRLRVFPELSEEESTAGLEQESQTPASAQADSKADWRRRFFTGGRGAVGSG